MLAYDPGTKTSEIAGHNYEGERAPYLHDKLSVHYERLQTDILLSFILPDSSCYLIMGQTVKELYLPLKTHTSPTSVEEEEGSPQFISFLCGV